MTYRVVAGAFDRFKVFVSGKDDDGAVWGFWVATFRDHDDARAYIAAKAAGALPTVNGEKL